MSRDFDAIIVGSGPAGSTAAEILTEAGLSVLIFERGRNHLIDLDNPAVLPRRFSNDELKYMTRHFLGPDPWAEPRTFRTSIAEDGTITYGELAAQLGVPRDRIVALGARGRREPAADPLAPCHRAVGAGGTTRGATPGEWSASSGSWVDEGALQADARPEDLS